MSSEVERDEVYIVAGHKGCPDIVAKLGRLGRRQRLKGAPGRGTLAGEKPPILGMIQRNGEVVLRVSRLRSGLIAFTEVSSDHSNLVRMSFPG